MTAVSHSASVIELARAWFDSDAYRDTASTTDATAVIQLASRRTERSCTDDNVRCHRWIASNAGSGSGADRTRSLIIRSSASRAVHAGQATTCD